MEIKNLKLAELRLNPTNPREVVEEKYKQLIDSILVFPKMMELRPVVYNARREVLGGNMRLRALQDIAQMSLERLESLESLERLQSDYRDVPIAEGAVVYCDIPYRNTASYVSGDFDHEAFYDWAEKLGQTHQVFISEYYMPRDRFDLVAETKKRALFNAKAREGEGVTERLFTPKKRV